MNTPTVYCIGPHQYRLTRWKDEGVGERWHVEYNLYGTNGVTVDVRPGEPNAWGWETSAVTFPDTEEGYAAAQRWVDHLLRPFDTEND